MQAIIQKWGNSLAIRIPKAFAKETHIENNSMVDLNLKDNHIIISLIDEPEDISLSSMLSEINDGNIHSAIDFGKSVGKEQL